MSGSEPIDQRVASRPSFGEGQPVVDLYETNGDLVLNFELPGVREKDISLSITGDVLTAKGERQGSR